MGECRNGFAISSNDAVRDRRLSRDARLLYVCLCGYANSERKCFPSVPTLCEDLNCNDKSFRKYRKELESYGYLKIEKRMGTRGQKSNLYVLQDKAHVRSTGGSISDAPVRQTGDAPVNQGHIAPVERTGLTVPSNIPREQYQHIFASPLAESLRVILNDNRAMRGGNIAKGSVKAQTGERYIKTILEAGYTPEEIQQEARNGKHTDWYRLEHAIIGRKRKKGAKQ